MIKHFSFDDKIVIYWLYENYIENANYSFYLNDKLIGSSTKTHFEFNGLKADTEYLIKLENKGKLLEEVKIKTLKTKKRLDICKIFPDIDRTGKTLVTKEIQQLLDNVKEDECVYFSKGIYLTGALFVHSNTEIYVDEGARIQGSSSCKDYLPYIPSRFEGIENMSYASLFNVGKMNHNEGYTTKNVIFRGKGEIIGGGRNLCWDIINTELPKIGKNDTGLADFLIAGRKRNRLLNISNTQNVIIEGLSMGYSASWNIHMLYSDNVVTTNCKISLKDYHNGDGWDPDSSSNCTLFNCIMDVGDDGIAIKSGKNPEGNVIDRPCHDINVFDITSKYCHGCAIGSEMSGGVYNVFFYDNDFINSYFGLHIKATPKRGAYVKNVVMENCKASAIRVEYVGYNDDGESVGLPIFSNFKFKNISLTGILHHAVGIFPDNHIEKLAESHICIKGSKENPSTFSNMTFENIILKNNGKTKEENIICENAENVEFKDIKVE